MSGVVASLDTEKAFDSIEWGYLWKIFSKFWFGPGFMKLLWMLYASPEARIHTNSCLSEVFMLGRGMRQGCPFFPGLFTLALEPLAILFRAKKKGLGDNGGPDRGKTVDVGG